MSNKSVPVKPVRAPLAELIEQEIPSAPQRRVFLKQSAALAGTAVGAGMAGQAAAGALEIPASMTTPGRPLGAYGQPAAELDKLQRGILKPYGDLAPGAGVTMTPLEELDGMITPNGLHFERHHNGIPDIKAAEHRLVIHGLVERNLSFSMEALLRYPRVSRICFIECSGNSFFNTFAEPMQMSCGMLNGLVSCTEWTGVSLRLLLEEAGLKPEANWLLAEGADAAGMSRSVPLAKALDDAILALFQNGEPIRPEQGYPVRLLLPGWEGNMNVKWLRRLKITQGPTHTRDETSKYTDMLTDGSAEQFTFPMAVKSVITRPSQGQTLSAPGFYEISGIAWSGEGKIDRVEVSTDNGATWTDATLVEPVLDKALTRFRLPWEWDGQATQLMSRAHDSTGAVQPLRAAWKSRYHAVNIHHYNAIQIWAINATGEVSNVYA